MTRATVLRATADAVREADEQIPAHLSFAERRQLQRLRYRAASQRVKDAAPCVAPEAVVRRH